jgi:hypothetical protein
MSDTFNDGRTITGKAAKFLGGLFYRYVIGKSEQPEQRRKTAVTTKWNINAEIGDDDDYIYVEADNGGFTVFHVGGSGHSGPIGYFDDRKLAEVAADALAMHMIAKRQR